MEEQADYVQSNMVIGSRQGRLNKAGLYLGLAMAMLFAFFPIYWMFITSIKPNEDVFAFPPTFIPTNVNGRTLLKLLPKS